jgi:hypothetical protein
MSWVNPTTVAPFDTLSASRWNQDVVANGTELAPLFAAWQSWTPTLTGVGFTITQGNSAVVGRYIKVGRLVHYTARWEFGSTTSFGAGAGSFALSVPVTAAVAYGPAIGSNVMFLDSGTNHFSTTIAVVDSTTTSVRVLASAAAFTDVEGRAITTTSPFTWATNDTVWWSGVYESAS